MEVYILIEHMDQSEYTEPHWYSSASESSEIHGVYDSYLKAEAEKERLEALDRQNQEELDTDPCYYDIETYTVE